MENDRALFAAWTDGDSAAGQRLIERHYDAIVRFFRTKAGSAGDDLVQRTFLALAESRGRFRGESSVRSFLFGIARNILLEHIRGKVRDAKVDPDFGVSSIHELDPGVSTAVSARAEHRLLIKALQCIPLEMQLALELFYWEELTVTELAEVLGIPAGTVKSRLHRGRALLREAMENVPADPADRQSVRQLIDRWAAGVREQIPS